MHAIAVLQCLIILPILSQLIVCQFITSGTHGLHEHVYIIAKHSDDGSL